MLSTLSLELLSTCCTKKILLHHFNFMTFVFLSVLRPRSPFVIKTYSHVFLQTLYHWFFNAHLCRNDKTEWTLILFRKKKLLLCHELCRISLFPLQLENSTVYNPLLFPGFLSKSLVAAMARTTNTSSGSTAASKKRRSIQRPAQQVSTQLYCNEVYACYLQELAMGVIHCQTLSW